MAHTCALGMGFTLGFRTDSGYGQWLRTVKVVLVHSYGPQNNDKVKEPANEVAIFPRKPSARQGC